MLVSQGNKYIFVAFIHGYINKQSSRLPKNMFEHVTRYSIFGLFRHLVLIRESCNILITLHLLLSVIVFFAIFIHSNK